MFSFINRIFRRNNNNTTILLKEIYGQLRLLDHDLELTVKRLDAIEPRLVECERNCREQQEEIGQHKQSLEQHEEAIGELDSEVHDLQKGAEAVDERAFEDLQEEVEKLQGDIGGFCRHLRDAVESLEVG